MTERWDGERITTWATANFGESDSYATAIRMNKEMAELLSALYHQKWDIARGEIADLGVMLKQIAYKEGFVPRVTNEIKRGRKLILVGTKLNYSFSALTMMLSPYATGSYSDTISTYDKVVHYLNCLAIDLDLDLNEVVDAKMDINEARQWEKQADGSYQHV